jgi:hypothetical protein
MLAPLCCAILAEAGVGVSAHQKGQSARVGTRQQTQARQCRRGRVSASEKGKACKSAWRRRRGAPFENPHAAAVHVGVRRRHGEAPPVVWPRKDAGIVRVALRCVATCGARMLSVMPAARLGATGRAAPQRAAEQRRRAGRRKQRSVCACAAHARLAAPSPSGSSRSQSGTRIRRRKSPGCARGPRKRRQRSGRRARFQMHVRCVATCSAAALAPRSACAHAIRKKSVVLQDGVNRAAQVQALQRSLGHGECLLARGSAIFVVAAVQVV